MRVFKRGLVFLAVIAMAGQAEAESWPTPYTAEEIRDVWVEGFWLDTRVESAEGVVVNRIEVLEWSSEGAVLRETPNDAADDELEGLASMAVTWEQLRSHAMFDKDSTTRKREIRATPLGTLEGWLFTRTDSNGRAEFFFADGLPGPPVVYGQTGADGVTTSQAVQVARYGVDPASTLLESTPAPPV